MIYINVLLFCSAFGVEKISRFPFLREGLKTDGENFTLNGEPFRVLSGSLHYFRVPREFWERRLKLFRNAGLNTVTERVEIFIDYKLSLLLKRLKMYLD